MKKVNVFKLIFLILFAGIVVIPILKMDFSGGKYSPNEQRNLAVFPVTKNNETGKIETGRTKIQDWVNDNIGFRENLLKMYVNFKFNILGQSTSSKVMIGKDGWFFYTLDNNIQIATGEYPLTDDDLKTIAQNQQAISDYYKSVGVNYILMLTPSKVSVYPEYLPMSVQTIKKTPVDIVAEYLRENTDIIVYSAKDALLEAKNSGAGQLYHKTDTHWNEKGAYYTYKGLHKTMVDNGILDDKPVEVTFNEGEYKGEFSAMLGDESILPLEKAPITNWNMQSVELHEGELYNKVQEKENQFGTHQGANVFSNPTKKYTAQIYGDSQIEVVRKIPQLLSEHFSTFVKYSVRNISISVDEAANPDVVIFSCSERYINPLLIQQADLSILADGNELPQIIFPCNQTFYNGMWLDNVNSADLNTGEYIDGQIPKSLYQDGDTVILNGWAADFNVGMPLSALYIKIGDKTIKCQYGMERTDVSHYFQNENLKMTGFNVTVPKSDLDGVDKIEFIQVGNDGSYRYENVVYTLTE